MIVQAKAVKLTWQRENPQSHSVEVQDVSIYHLEHLCHMRCVLEDLPILAQERHSLSDGHVRIQQCVEGLHAGTCSLL